MVAYRVQRSVLRAQTCPLELGHEPLVRPSDWHTQCTGSLAPAVPNSVKQPLWAVTAVCKCK
jgi:hypothetical protein